ncbi:MAG: preprotein translocase subunit SecE [Cyanobacteria bacterium]|nr:preprotein translocase subunit SecE [Cyanobacteriota bacterium]MDA1019934.1 preprotein translocase subunit SecE [Cyanobacteriota bacterium]
MNKEDKKDKSEFMKWLTEDDAPEIGIASKEPLPDYLRGVKTEFNKIEWPSKEQVQNEFTTVVIIVAIISAIVYFIDIGLDKVVDTIKGI